ncbi:MAG TPA: M3 family metallopeptidase, partial [Propionicimonas sp.]|nr:M3 family metallopeptidase [Propionicimonas sp.]
MPLDASNPLATVSTLPYELPDYSVLRDEHYRPAIEAGMAEQLAQLADLAANPDPATTANVIEAWESSGQLFSRALNAFYTKQPADTNPVLDAADEAIAPQLAAHSDAIYLNRRLYDRLAALAVRVEAGEVQLDPASAYWLERRLLDFERSGVNLPEDDQARLRTMNHRIAELQSAFGREALAGMNGGAVLVTDVGELDGLSQAEIDAARERATETDKDGWLIELENTSAQRPLDVLTNRALRERIHLASVNRGLGGAHDTRAIIVELTRLRAERATLLGFANHASYVAADACAGTGKAVWDLLTRLAPAAVANARDEAVDLERVWRRFEPEAPLAAWDWQFVSEQLRAERYALDASVLRPYLELERVLHEGVFAAANGLYGITFTERPELVSYNPEGRVFEVADA